MGINTYNVEAKVGRDLAHLGNDPTAIVRPRKVWPDESERRGGAVEPLAAGESTALGPGDWVVETEGAVHYGANDGPAPVVVLAATLFAAGQPPSAVATPPPIPAATL
jgi:hypothetical protein